MDLFFYGTLMDLEVMSRVLGRQMPPDTLQPATLSGWRRVRALDQAYPILLADPAGAVEGRLASGLSAEDVARLDRYEGDGYDRVEISVSAGGGPRAVQIYRPRAHVQADPKPWDFAAWVAGEKAGFLSTHPFPG